MILMNQPRGTSTAQARQPPACPSWGGRQRALRQGCRWLRHQGAPPGSSALGTFAAVQWVSCRGQILDLSSRLAPSDSGVKAGMRKSALLL